jgi:hypothetical protein
VVALPSLQLHPTSALAPETPTNTTGPIKKRNHTHICQHTESHPPTHTQQTPTHTHTHTQNSILLALLLSSRSTATLSLVEERPARIRKNTEPTSTWTFPSSTWSSSWMTTQSWLTSRRLVTCIWWSLVVCRVFPIACCVCVCVWVQSEV